MRVRMVRLRVLPIPGVPPVPRNETLGWAFEDLDGRLLSGIKRILEVLGSAIAHPSAGPPSRALKRPSRGFAQSSIIVTMSRARPSSERNAWSVPFGR